LQLQLDEEFATLQPNARDLKTCWPAYREKVLSKASARATTDSDLQELLQQVDDLNEGDVYSI